MADLHFYDPGYPSRCWVQGGVDLHKPQRPREHKSPITNLRYAPHYPGSSRDGVEVLDREEPLAQFQHNG